MENSERRECGEEHTARKGEKERERERERTRKRIHPREGDGMRAAEIVCRLCSLQTHMCKYNSPLIPRVVVDGSGCGVGDCDGGCGGGVASYGGIGGWGGSGGCGGGGGGGGD